MRAVLDVNVLVSALLSRRGAPATIIGSWLEGGFDLVVSELLLAELERALGYPKVAAYVSRDAADAFVALLRGAAIVAVDPGKAPERSSDPGDDYLLALAEAESALLVTGDQHLLDLADRFPIRSPRDFLESL